MNYHAEIWLRGYAKDHIRSLEDTEEKSHPHITLARPFEISSSEILVKSKVEKMCAGVSPISFDLEGYGNFDGIHQYIPVESLELLKFNNRLEHLLRHDVNFAEKLNPYKILHATVNTKKEIPPQEQIEQFMLRLTMIKDKKIWFSYDFVTQQSFDREQSLNQPLWKRTISEFEEKYQLLPTRQGFQNI